MIIIITVLVPLHFCHLLPGLSVILSFDFYLILTITLIIIYKYNFIDVHVDVHVKT